MTQIKNIMSKHVKTVSAGSSLEDAYTLMQESRIRHLPVLNDDGDVTGIVSYKNIINNRAVLTMPVEYFMSYPVIEIHENTSVKNTVLKMLEQKISSLLITNDQREVVGIVTTDDLLWELARQFKNEPEEDQGAPLLISKGVRTIGEIARLLSQAGI